jgi:hypothetical protein
MVYPSQNSPVTFTRDASKRMRRTIPPKASSISSNWFDQLGPIRPLQQIPLRGKERRREPFASAYSFDFAMKKCNLPLKAVVLDFDCPA